MTLQLFTLLVMPLLGLAIAAVGYLTIILTEPAKPRLAKVEANSDRFSH